MKQLFSQQTNSNLETTTLEKKPAVVLVKETPNS